MPDKTKASTSTKGKAPANPAPPPLLAPKAQPTPAVPTLPLTEAARSAYQALYDRNEQAIQATSDPGVLGGLNGAQTEVRNILIKDNMYRLHASSALYDALLEQIGDTNNKLKDLQTQIAAIKDDFDYAGDIIDAISTVLKVV